MGRTGFWVEKAFRFRRHDSLLEHACYTVFAEIVEPSAESEICPTRPPKYLDFRHVLAQLPND